MGIAYTLIIGLPDVKEHVHLYIIKTLTCRRKFTQYESDVWFVKMLVKVEIPFIYTSSSKWTVI